MTISSFGGAYQEAVAEAFFEPYSELTGVEIIENMESEVATIRAQVEAEQVDWDVVDQGGFIGLDNYPPTHEILEPITEIYDAVPRDELTRPELYATDHRVGWQTTGFVLGYNTEELAGKVPESWADFFDLENFPGRRAIIHSVQRGIIESALMADGVAPDELYPLDVERALAKLDTIKDQLNFPGSVAEGQEMLGSGVVSMAQIPNGRAWAAKHENGFPVEVQWNQGILVGDVWVVPKGSPNATIAKEFIAWTVCKENNANLAAHFPYGPMNHLSDLPASVDANDLPSTHLDVMVARDDIWWADNIEWVEELYNEWATR